MYKKIFALSLCCFMSFASYGADDDLIREAQDTFNAAQLVCSGVSDEISKVSNVSKVNTAVTAVGTVAATGALYAGVKKSQEEKEIDELVEKMCAAGGCTPDGVRKMSDAEFFYKVIEPMAEIAELQERLKKSKKLGNWRTGLMAGTIGTNVVSAILSGVNKNQSDLIQHIQACNEAMVSVNLVSDKLRRQGVSPIEYPVVKRLDSIKTWCNSMNVSDVEKIEKRMTGVMGTSIAGAVIGVAGTATSAAANSDKYMNESNRLSLSEQEVKKKDNLNTAANIMAGANIVTGAVETGLNISLINLTKKLIKQAEQCEKVFE